MTLRFKNRGGLFGSVLLLCGLLVVPATAEAKVVKKVKKLPVVAQGVDGTYKFPKRTVKWTKPPLAVFKPCFETIECALVEAPMNYADPFSPALVLSVTRRRASDPARRIGALLVNPGGPGASSYTLIRGAERIFPPEVIAQFDIIGLDPRGTANSAPVSCGVDPLDAAKISTTESAIKIIAATCGKRSGQLLKYIDTESSVRDHDWVRQALGEQQINFLGFSYGGYLGAMYAQLFPTTLRSVVLDSGLDHTRFGTALLQEGYAANERTLRAFLQQCADGTFTPCAFNDGTDLLARYDKVLSFYGDPNLGSERRLAARSNFEGIVETLLEVQGRGGWKILADGLNRAASSTADPLRSFDLGSFPSSPNYEVLESIFAYQCHDGFMTQDPGQIAALQANIKSVAPHFQVNAGGSAELYRICQYWPQPTKPQPPIQPNGIAPILLVGATLDMVTPIEWQQSMVATTGGTLLTRVGSDHGQLGNGTCINPFIVDFLINLRLPPADTLCPN
jgi:pimeloyl-ACP methyl ester carboxylesterase